MTRVVKFLTYFNSQPHKEADFQCDQQSRAGTISTHSLTRRLTFTDCNLSNERLISTHSLTRRLTTAAQGTVNKN